jgi:hypothetical protein
MIVLYLKLMSKNTFSFPPVFILSTSHSTNLSFRDELINEHLASYSRTYDNSSYECNISKPLSAVQKHEFPIISQLLITLREQIISYPNEYFHGRGIVLTVGLDQWSFAEINLKMILLTGTRLPVQVNMFLFNHI